MTSFPVETVITEAATIRVESLPMGVKRIVLKRPEVRNAFDETMMAELRDVLDHLAGIPDESQMRLLVLAGDGKAFSAGADLGYMKRLAEKSVEESTEDARGLARLFYRLADFPTPVVAVVQGAAIGGGMGLAVCADYVLAEEDAIFATTEVLLGIVPGVISPYIVRKVGIANATPMMLTGRRLKATEARRLGLVHEICAAENLAAALDRILASHLAAGPAASRRTKGLLKSAKPLPGPELIEETARQIAQARSSAEGREGLQAFFDKKTPSWASGLKAIRKKDK